MSKSTLEVSKKTSKKSGPKKTETKAETTLKVKDNTTVAPPSIADTKKKATKAAKEDKPVSPPQEEKKVDIHRVARMMYNQVPKSEIAKKFGISVQALNRLIKETCHMLPYD